MASIVEDSGRSPILNNNFLLRVMQSMTCLVSESADLPMKRNMSRFRQVE